MLKKMTAVEEVVELSIVVATNRPVKVLKEILTSIFETSPLTTEVIVINDDPKRKISEKDFIVFPNLDFSTNDKFQISILNNDSNKGPGYSRNRGVEIAKGSYILFIDDDDEIDLSILGCLNEVNNNADIVCLGFEDTSGVFTNYDLQSKLPNRECFESEILQIAFINNTFLPAQIQPYLFHKSFLEENKIRFPDAYVGEDLAFNTMAMLKCRIILNLPGFFYRYVSRPGTLKSSQGVDRSLDLLQCLLDINNFKNNILQMDKISNSFCKEILIFYQSLFCMRVLLADKESDVPFISSEYSNEEDFRLFNDAFNNKHPIKDLRNHIDKYANEVKILCVQNLLPVLKNFTKVFVFCVGSLGRAIARLVLEGCKKEVIFVDAMFDKFPTKQVDGLEIISPEHLDHSGDSKCVIICNPQPAIEKKIANEIKKKENSLGLKSSKLIFGSQVIKESAMSFFGKCEVVF